MAGLPQEQTEHPGQNDSALIFCRNPGGLHEKNNSRNRERRHPAGGSKVADRAGSQCVLPGHDAEARDMRGREK